MMIVKRFVLLIKFYFILIVTWERWLFSTVWWNVSASGILIISMPSSSTLSHSSFLHAFFPHLEKFLHSFVDVDLELKSVQNSNNRCERYLSRIEWNGLSAAARIVIDREGRRSRFDVRGEDENKLKNLWNFDWLQREISSREMIAIDCSYLKFPVESLKRSSILKPKLQRWWIRDNLLSLELIFHIFFFLVFHRPPSFSWHHRKMLIHSIFGRVVVLKVSQSNSTHRWDYDEKIY